MTLLAALVPDFTALDHAAWKAFVQDNIGALGAGAPDFGGSAPPPDGDGGGGGDDGNGDGDDGNGDGDDGNDGGGPPPS